LLGVRIALFGLFLRLNNVSTGEPEVARWGNEAGADVSERVDIVSRRDDYAGLLASYVPYSQMFYK
jgi:hypothetical protein